MSGYHTMVAQLYFYFEYSHNCYHHMNKLLSFLLLPATLGTCFTPSNYFKESPSHMSFLKDSVTKIKFPDCILIL